MENPNLIKADRVNHERTGTVTADFGVVDSRGRALGARAELVECDQVPHDPARFSYPWLLEFLGRAYGFRPVSTRAGKSYGATQSVRWFSTIEARNADADAYLAGAKKRATKTAK